MQLQSLVNVLTSSRKVLEWSGFRAASEGICANVRFDLRSFSDETCFLSLFKEFVQFKSMEYAYSGNTTYPIKHAKGWSTGYYDAARNESMWIGEYGDLRKDVLSKFIQYLELLVIRKTMEDLYIGTRDTYHGICWHIPSSILGKFDRMFEDFMISDKMSYLYSGDYLYPIPSSDDTNSQKAYHSAATKGLMWTGDYGERRVMVVGEFLTHINGIIKEMR